VFIIPSPEEAFDQSALEAAACGAVVAGFAASCVRRNFKSGVDMD
jgi:hypothetical protein